MSSSIIAAGIRDDDLKKTFLVLFLLLFLLIPAACSDSQQGDIDYSEESNREERYSEEEIEKADESSGEDQSERQVNLVNSLDDFDFVAYQEDAGYLILAYYSLHDGKLDSVLMPELKEEMLLFYTEYSSLSADQIIRLQNDIALAEAIWERVAGLIPDFYLENIAYFELFTDGEEDFIGAIEELEDRPGFFIFSLDLDDMLNNDLSLNNSLLFETIAHELAHVITLAPDQVSWLDLEDSDPATYYIYEYDLDTAPESYVNLFFERFWTDIYLEWSDFYYEYGIQYYGEDHLYEENEQTLYDYLDDFYDKYAERFVTEYAATSPVEDVAETFMLFVLEDKPTGNKVSDTKMRFFYEFPELVEIRDHAQEYLESIGYSNN